MSKLSFFILLLELKWVRFTSHFMVLYFRNLHLDLPKIFVLFWTPVLSRHGEENLTSRKNHLVHLWPTSFIRVNYVQPPPNKIFPVRRCISGTFYQCHFQKMVGWVAFKVSLLVMLKFKSCKMWRPMSLFILLRFLLSVWKVIPYRKGMSWLFSKYLTIILWNRGE